MTLAIEVRADEADRTRRYVASRHWTDHTLGAVVADGLARSPARAVRVHSDARPWSSTFVGEAHRARRVAGGLAAVGVRAGDPVAVQLPNWAEAIATFFAIALLGAVPVPIVPFYGRKEVEYILAECGTGVLVTADRFRHIDYVANVAEIRPRLPALGQVFVVGADVLGDACEFGALLDSDPVDAAAPVDPGAPAVVAYTSGTTADPKGVVHSHRSLVAEIRQLAAIQPRGVAPALVGAPIGHAIGLLGGLLLPVWEGEAIHLLDVWDPVTVLGLMTEERLSAGNGATYFFTSLLDHPDCTPEHHRPMDRIGLGGSPVPVTVGERAAALGISTMRVYGCTEHPSITGGTHRDPPAKRIRTDGRPLDGVELEVRDEEHRVLGAGEAGELWSRGPDGFLGYTDAALTRAALDTEGWLATGDVGVVDEDGYVTIVDRKKDIIIRGGENVSALEVEEQLLRVPGVAEVAVVAAPDERLGEHGCAFVRMQAGVGSGPELAALREHLEQAGLARPKWPEEVRAVEDFPRTPSGKIQKFVLRQRLRDERG